MLKRNGQQCEHSVPDYSGHLTNTEFLAYNAVFNSVEDAFNQFSEVTDSLNNTETSLSRSLDSEPEQIDSPQTAAMQEANGIQWQIIKPLLKSKRLEVLWCKRKVDGKNEFAVLERFDADSPLAKAQGISQVQMTSENPRQLFRDFVNEQRETLRLWGQDIVATAREKLEEKYPGQDLSRVVKAISQRCTKKISSAEAVVPIRTQKRNENVRI